MHSAYVYGKFGYGLVRQGGAGQGRAGQGRAGQGRAGQGRAGQGRAGQGRAGHLQVVGDLEAVDGVWVADVVLHQAGLLLGDATGVWHQLDAPPSR